MRDGRNTGRDARVSTLWIMLLTLASTATTLVLACATPFTALAALAATQMRLRDGIWLMTAAWAVSQIVGFCVLDYPRDPSTFAWGAALGMAAIAGLLVARGVVARYHRLPGFVAMAAAYLAATLAFKAVILFWSFGLGGVEIALSPAINARQFVRNGAILIGLLLLYCGLIAVGLPATAPARRAPT